MVAKDDRHDNADVAMSNVSSYYGRKFSSSARNGPVVVGLGTAGWSEGGLCVATGGGGGGKSASLVATGHCARRSSSPLWREKWRVAADTVQRRVRQL